MVMLSSMCWKLHSGRKWYLTSLALSSLVSVFMYIRTYVCVCVYVYCVPMLVIVLYVCLMACFVHVST